MTTPLLFSRIPGGDSSGGIEPPKRFEQSSPTSASDFRTMFRTMLSGLPRSTGSPPQLSSEDVTSASMTQLALSDLLKIRQGSPALGFASVKTVVVKSTTLHDQSHAIGTQSLTANSAHNQQSNISSRYSTAENERQRPIGNMTLPELVSLAMRTANIRGSEVSTLQRSSTVVRQTDTMTDASRVQTIAARQSNDNEASTQALTENDTTKRTSDKAFSNNLDCVTEKSASPERIVIRTRSVNSNETTVRSPFDKEEDAFEKSNIPSLEDFMVMLGTQILEPVLVQHKTVHYREEGTLTLDTVSAASPDIGEIQTALDAIKITLQQPFDQFNTALAGLFSTVSSIQTQLAQQSQGQATDQQQAVLQALPDGTLSLLIPINEQNMQTTVTSDQTQAWQQLAGQSLDAVNTALAALQQSIATQVSVLPETIRTVLQTDTNISTSSIPFGKPLSTPTNDASLQGIKSASTVGDDLLHAVLQIALQNMATMDTRDQNSDTANTQIQDFAPPRITEIALQVDVDTVSSVSNNPLPANNSSSLSAENLPTIGDILTLVQQFSAHDSDTINAGNSRDLQPSALKILLATAQSTSLESPLKQVGFETRGSVAVNIQQSQNATDLLANTLQSATTSNAQLIGISTGLPVIDSTAEASLPATSALNSLNLPSVDSASPSLSSANQVPIAPSADMTARIIAPNVPTAPSQAGSTAFSSHKKENSLLVGNLISASPGIASTENTRISPTSSADSQAGLQQSKTPHNPSLPSISTVPTEATPAPFDPHSVAHGTNEQSIPTEESIGTKFETIDPKQSAQSMKLPTELIAKANVPLTQVFKDITPRDIPRTIMQAFRGFVPMAGGVGGAIQLQLNPEHLGGVMVQVFVKNMSASINIETDSADAQRAVEAQIASLKDRLTAQGLKVETVEVNTRTQNDPTSLDMNRQGESSHAQRDERQSRQTFVESFRHRLDAQQTMRPNADTEEALTARDLVRRMKAGQSATSGVDSVQRNFEKYA